VVSLSVTPRRPAQGGSQKYHALLGPEADPALFGVGIIAHKLGRLEWLNLGSLLVDDVAFGDAGGLDLHQLGEPVAVAGGVESVAVDPPMIAALAPRRVGVEGAEALRNPALAAVLLMPDGALGFQQALVLLEGLTGESLVEGFSPLPHTRDELLEHGIEFLIAPQECGAMRQALESDRLRILGMGREPAPLGLEPADPTDLHEEKEHQEYLLRVGQRVSSVRRKDLLVFKLVTQFRDHLDMIRNGWFLHGVTSLNRTCWFSKR